MKVRIEATAQELEDIKCESVEKLAAQLREQLDSCVVGDAGQAGSDGLVSYDLTAALGS